MPSQMDTLDGMLQADRRKKAGQLRKGASTAEFPKIPSGPRGAIQKHLRPNRASSQPPSSMEGKWTHDLFAQNGPSTAPRPNTKLASNVSPSVAKSLASNRLFTALHGQVEPADLGVNIRGAAKPGFSIKGSAGPFAVHASNFAPGTTASDIRTAIEPIGRIVNCAILSASPTVIAEIVFEKKEDAERCIEQYNNQKADGNILHLVFRGTPSLKVPARNLNANSSQSNSRQTSTNNFNPPSGPSRNANGVIDGTRGFGSQPSQPGRLYSDGMVSQQQRGRGFNR